MLCYVICGIETEPGAVAQNSLDFLTVLYIILRQSPPSCDYHMKIRRAYEVWTMLWKIAVDVSVYDPRRSR